MTTLSEKLAALSNASDQPEAGPAPSRPESPMAARPAALPRRANAEWDETKRRVRELVLAELGPKLTGSASMPGPALEREVKAALDRILGREDIRISPVERRKFFAEVMSDTLGYGPLDGPLADATVTEIMCNAFDDVWIERGGVIERTTVSFTDEAQYRHVIDKIVSAVGRRVDESSPMVDARLPDGSRVNAIIPPLAVGAPVLTIRKFAKDPYGVKDLINFGTFSIDLGVMLEACVRGKLNVLVSGGTGTGKTTCLNVLSSFIPHQERIITIEDAAELQLQQPHVVRLEARPSNAEGRGEVRIRDLVRNSLRMRPDRIVVGECRGGEALDMLQAMNTGHAGSLTTVHANTSRDALSRLETMVLMAGFDLPVRAIREQIASAIDVIIQLQRLPDGSRRVVEVTEVQGLEGDVILLQEIFVFHQRQNAEGKQVGTLDPTGLRPRFADKLREEGIELPASTFRPSETARLEMAGRPPVPTRAELLRRRR